jgi:chemotaxis protein MotB
MLRREGCTVAYCPTIFSKGAQSTAHGVIYTDGFANDVNDTCGELLGFFWHSGEEGKGTISFTDGGKAVEKLVRANAEELTFQWTKRYRRKDDQLVLEELAGEMSVGYVWTEPFGVLLVKDGKYYRYQNSENHYYEEQVGQFLGDDVAVEDLSQSQVNKLIAEREAILTELQKAFEEAQIHVEVDPNGGKVTMDSSILFGVDQDSLSEEGKEYLDRFLKVYSAVVLGERFVDTVSEVLVEGHTDTDGSYEHNLDLSERRASHVMQYCLEICPELEGRISAKGCSFDNPIYDAEGAVDKDASRRVVFKFKLRVAEENIE